MSLQNPLNVLVPVNKKGENLKNRTILHSDHNCDHNSIISIVTTTVKIKYMHKEFKETVHPIMKICCSEWVE